MAPPSQALHTDNETPIGPPPVMAVAPQRIMKRTASAPKLTESKSLANETRDLLGRAGVAGVARRCAHYTPTLKELTSTSFSDYIRGEVLGVPIPGYEFLYVYEDTKESKASTTTVTPHSTPPLCQETAVSVVPAAKQISPLPQLSSTERVMRTRSKAKAVETTKKVPTKVHKQTRDVPEPKQYKMCWYKLRDGIAKVSLPAGFGAKVDATARGRLVSVFKRICFVFVRFLVLPILFLIHLFLFLVGKRIETW